MKKTNIITNYISLALILFVLSYFAFSGKNTRISHKELSEKALIKQ